MAGEEIEGSWGYYQLAMQRALNDLEAAHGPDWATHHGIEEMEHRMELWCSKCGKILADFCRVREHLTSNNHMHGMRVEAYLRNPLEFIPEPHVRYAELQGNRAMCRLCHKEMQEGHWNSQGHLRRVQWQESLSDAEQQPVTPAPPQLTNEPESPAAPALTDAAQEAERQPVSLPPLSQTNAAQAASSSSGMSVPAPQPPAEPYPWHIHHVLLSEAAAHLQDQAAPAYAGGFAEDRGEPTAAPPPQVSAAPEATRSFATQAASSTSPAVPKSRSPWASPVNAQEILQPGVPFEETF